MGHKIEYYFASHVGKCRKVNQDNFYCNGSVMHHVNRGTGGVRKGSVDCRENPIFAVFDGMGGVAHYAINLAETKGSCSLTESKDGAAVVRMDIGKGPALYVFKTVSPQGEFTLTDAANIVHKFVPTA